jgi:hypothetical protein
MMENLDGVTLVKNYFTCDESTFVDYKHMNFLLKTGAGMFKVLDRFIPFSEIGPLKKK